jgi:hypothetical protein
MNLIAEFCQNHNGDRNILEAMIYASKENGATHAKIQGLYSDELTSRSEFEDSKAKIYRPYHAEYERLRKLDLSFETEKWFVEKCKESNRNNLRGFCKNPKYYAKSFEGHSHTDEVKKSIGEKNSLHQEGEKNSQFGTLWVNKEGANKKIKKEEKDKYLEEGWFLGINYEKFTRSEHKNILTREKVLEIRGLLEKGESGRKIAAYLNIGRTSVEKIRRDESYSYY